MFMNKWLLSMLKYANYVDLQMLLLKVLVPVFTLFTPKSRVSPLSPYTAPRTELLENLFLAHSMQTGKTAVVDKTKSSDQCHRAGDWIHRLHIKD